MHEISSAQSLGYPPSKMLSCGSAVARRRPVAIHRPQQQQPMRAELNRQQQLQGSTEFQPAAGETLGSSAVLRTSPRR